MKRRLLFHIRIWTSDHAAWWFRDIGLGEENSSDCLAMRRIRHFLGGVLAVGGHFVDLIALILQLGAMKLEVRG